MDVSYSKSPDRLHVLVGCGLEHFGHTAGRRGGETRGGDEERD